MRIASRRGLGAQRIWKETRFLPCHFSADWKFLDISALRTTTMASYARLIRQKYPYRAPSASVDHLVVGGGVVGLAVAASLVNTAGSGRTTFLVERRQLVSLRTVFCAQHLSVSLAHKPSR